MAPPKTAPGAAFPLPAPSYATVKTQSNTLDRNVNYEELAENPRSALVPATKTHSLQALEVLQRAVRLVEDEREDVLASLYPGSEEGVQVRLVRDLEGHLAARSGHLELEVFAALARGLREVEGDAAQRELQVDLLVGHGAGAEDRKRLSSHRHRQVHDGDSFVRHLDN